MLTIQATNAIPTEGRFLPEIKRQHKYHKKIKVCFDPIRSTSGRHEEVWTIHTWCCTLLCFTLPHCVLQVMPGVIESPSSSRARGKAAKKLAREIIDRLLAAQDVVLSGIRQRFTNAHRMGRAVSAASLFLGSSDPLFQPVLVERQLLLKRIAVEQSYHPSDYPLMFESLQRAITQVLENIRADVDALLDVYAMDVTAASVLAPIPPPIPSPASDSRAQKPGAHPVASFSGLDHSDGSTPISCAPPASPVPKRGANYYRRPSQTPAPASVLTPVLRHKVLGKRSAVLTKSRRVQSKESPAETSVMSEAPTRVSLEVNLSTVARDEDAYKAAQSWDIPSAQVSFRERFLAIVSVVSLLQAVSV
jgi:hypothetical protein